MQNYNNKRQQTPPPNLLKGILTAVLGITIAILALSWFVIDYQLEKLVIKRTSEYAHSIARIAADSSAEALLSDDKVQLNLLVENVAKDPYIRQATIISEDGQIVTQYPEEIELTTPTQAMEKISDFSPIEDDPVQDEQTSANVKHNNKASSPFILRQRNKIFFESIRYQDITAGWFKLEIDKYQLEQNFREIFKDIQVMISLLAVTLFALLIFILYRFDKSIKQLAINCQHLLFQNGIKPSLRKSQWLDSVKELSQSHQQRLHEHVSLPKKTDDWLHSRVVDNTLACYLEFKIDPQENSAIAENLTQAESFLNRSTQAFGVQSQGDILTGCLIPLVDSTPASEHSLTEAISLIALIAKLLSSLPTDIPVKAFIMRAPILTLEDEQEITTGVSLLARSMDKIKQLSLMANFGDIVSLSIPPEDLEKVAQITTIEGEGLEDKNTFTITKLNSSIQQQIARKFRYISSN